MGFRVSFRWQQSNTRTGGWSENLWNNLGTFDLVEAAARKLYAQFSAYKGPQAFCPRIRISNYPANRLVRPISTGAQPSPATTAFDADYPTTRLQLQLVGVAPQSAILWLGGIQDRDSKNGGFWLPVGADVGNFNSVVGLLTTASEGWSIYVLDPTVPKLVITQVNATTGQITTAAAHGYDGTIPVRLTGINGIDGINGVWNVQSVDATNFKLVSWPGSTQTFTKSNAFSRLQRRVFQAITAVNAIQITSHRVGKPTGLLGGRRRKPSKRLAGPLVVR